MRVVNSFMISLLLAIVFLSSLVFAGSKEVSVSVGIVEDRGVTGKAVSLPEKIGTDFMSFAIGATNDKNFPIVIVVFVILLVVYLMVKRKKVKKRRKNE